MTDTRKPNNLISVDKGALKMALNVLDSAGKNEVAQALKDSIVDSDTLADEIIAMLEADYQVGKDSARVYEEFYPNVIHNNTSLNKAEMILIRAKAIRDKHEQ